MVNLTNRPVYQKKGKPKKSKAYLEKVRQKPCCVCEKFGMQQLSPTTAHHPIHDRYGTLKTDDTMAIPLCDGHHQGMWDTSKLAIHKNKKKWLNEYGPDWSYAEGAEDG
jgi:hypothetical protein